MQWQSRPGNMPADVVKMTTVAMDHAMEEEASLSPSPSFSPPQLDKHSHQRDKRMLIVSLIYTYD